MRRVHVDVVEQLLYLSATFDSSNLALLIQLWNLCVHPQKTETTANSLNALFEPLPVDDIRQHVIIDTIPPVAQPILQTWRSYFTLVCLVERERERDCNEQRNVIYTDYGTLEWPRHNDHPIEKAQGLDPSRHSQPTAWNHVAHHFGWPVCAAHMRSNIIVQRATGQIRYHIITSC
jgi:hypothetical protein